MDRIPLTQRAINFRVQREISNAQAELHKAQYPYALMNLPTVFAMMLSTLSTIFLTQLWVQ